MLLLIFSTAFLSPIPLNKKYIIINAGHGGNDPEGVYSHFSEKEISLNITKEIQKFNYIENKWSALTRNSDSYPDLIARKKSYKKPVEIINEY
ncbi:N-acetylmuramoyl-L-alanine amidase [Chryseobacterium sp.]|uniref:N-acetylmuramoyl-L-alanine amidase n=1 Tax=Chryseobacterium sp. TaxID=1871047 RepID=UPI0025C07147|nr:N-acetylmuramoyl-L-alanine amidase [Chryseobacterium sp.]MBV8328571.1 N-acetylmuramoyl-L-alanine amidase [Chryseobacterium sp.]